MPGRDRLASGPFASVLTAEGRGAVAVVRVWGAGAIPLADRVFRPTGKRPLSRSTMGRLRVGRVGAGAGDEVVAVVVDGKPPEAEIQCHGGSAAVALVLGALIEGGARVRPPRAWARHSLGSSTRADAEVALASAPTARVAKILLDQAVGALDAELGVISKDGPDLNQLEALIGRGRVGLRLVEGWRIVLAGRPNVGKSRLMNALAGYDRAIVDPSPGTTRDVVTAPSAFDGWPVELADTAGLRDASDPIEAEGIALARAHQRRADLVVVVLDRSEPLGEPDRIVLLDHPDALVVANKSDLAAAWDESEVGALPISAEVGAGLDRLSAAIASRLVPDPPPSGSAVPFLPAHARRLAAIRAAIEEGRIDRANVSIARWLGEGGRGAVPDRPG